MTFTESEQIKWCLWGKSLAIFTCILRNGDFGSTSHPQQMSRSFCFETGLVIHIPCYTLYTLFPQMNTVRKTKPTFLQLEQYAQVCKMQFRLNECPWDWVNTFWEGHNVQVSTADHQSFFVQSWRFPAAVTLEITARICSHFLKASLGGKKGRQGILHLRNWAHLIIKIKDIFMLKQLFCEITQLHDPWTPPWDSLAVGNVETQNSGSQPTFGNAFSAQY